MYKGRKNGNSTLTGKRFEKITDFKIRAFSKFNLITDNKSYMLINNKIPKNISNKSYIYSSKQSGMKKLLLNKFNINTANILSRELKPDEFIINDNTKTIYVIEKNIKNVWEV